MRGVRGFKTFPASFSFQVPYHKDLGIVSRSGFCVSDPPHLLAPNPLTGFPEGPTREAWWILTDSRGTPRCLGSSAQTGTSGRCSGREAKRVERRAKSQPPCPLRCESVRIPVSTSLASSGTSSPSPSPVRPRLLLARCPTLPFAPFQPHPSNAVPCIFSRLSPVLGACLLRLSSFAPSRGVPYAPCSLPGPRAPGRRGRMGGLRRYGAPRRV